MAKQKKFVPTHVFIHAVRKGGDLHITPFSDKDIKGMLKLSDHLTYSALERTNFLDVTPERVFGVISEEVNNSEEYMYILTIREYLDGAKKKKSFDPSHYTGKRYPEISQELGKLS